MDEMEQAFPVHHGKDLLREKIEKLNLRPDVVFTEFGTRRRFSRVWQDYVVATLANRLPRAQFMGTSNVYLAMKYELTPVGTMPHEPFMIMGGIMRDVDDLLNDAAIISHNQVLKDWWEEYGQELSIALTDTYGSEFFFRDMTVDQAKKWKGLRHDSGDPIEWGERVIAFYNAHGIDPMEKVAIFSDGLDLPKIIEITDHFKDRLPVRFGWGTNLTNDLGIPALSLVVKAVEADGHGLVKLSDNLDKATGTPSNIERIKRLTGYAGNFREKCRY